MTDLPYRLDRIIVIDAPPEVVFRFFTTTERWAAWWGAGSQVDARPGGRMLIRHPNGIEVTGEIVDVRAPERFVFTYGYASGAPIPPSGSIVTIALEPSGAGTRLQLTHEFADGGARDEHVQGWRFQLSLFANIVADELHAGAASLVDAWLALWDEADDHARARRLAAIASRDVAFRDRFSALAGADDVLAHITAARRFMPGLHLEREGAVRHCQGTAIADWRATGPDGAPRGRGTNVYTLGADGRLASVVGFWG